MKVDLQRLSQLNRKRTSVFESKSNFEENDDVGQQSAKTEQKKIGVPVECGRQSVFTEKQMDTPVRPFEPKTDSKIAESAATAVHANAKFTDTPSLKRITTMNLKYQKKKDKCHLE